MIDGKKYEEIINITKELEALGFKVISSSDTDKLIVLAKGSRKVITCDGFDGIRGFYKGYRRAMGETNEKSEGKQ